MGVKKGVRSRYDWTISEILNFTVELSRTRCLNFSDILKMTVSAEYVWNFTEILKSYGSDLACGAPSPCRAGSSMIWNYNAELPTDVAS